jgi:hypothetical protein
VEGACAISSGKARWKMSSGNSASQRGTAVSLSKAKAQLCIGTRCAATMFHPLCSRNHQPSHLAMLHELLEVLPRPPGRRSSGHVLLVQVVFEGHACRRAQPKINTAATTATSAAVTAAAPVPAAEHCSAQHVHKIGHGMGPKVYVHVTVIPQESHGATAA